MATGAKKSASCHHGLEKKIVYEPVKLTQEYRNFDYMSPWEGINNNLEGDEKVNEEKDERS